MSLVPNFGSSRVGGQLSVPFGAEKRLGFGSVARINRNLKVSRPSEDFAVLLKLVERFVGEVGMWDGIYYIVPSSLNYSRKVAKCSKVRMNLIDENLARGIDFVRPSDILAYDLVQGAHVRWSYILDKSVCDPPPTAVLLHGILGCRKNWGTFARRLAHEFPTWQIVITQFLLVDLRCHGDSAAIKKRGPNTVASTALDILKLLGKLKLTPRVLVGHSFGGKVALSMVDQVAKPLARPVRVWVLDATPGKVRAGGDKEDHPFELISFLRTLPKQLLCISGGGWLELRVGSLVWLPYGLFFTGITPDVNLLLGVVAGPRWLTRCFGLNLNESLRRCLLEKEREIVPDGNEERVTGLDMLLYFFFVLSYSLKVWKVASKRDVVVALERHGFSKDVAQWVVTNLRESSPSGSSPSSFSWVFDLNGIAEMYRSYEETSLWKIVEDVPRGVHVNFLKAERSLHRWALEDIQRIHVAEELAADEGGGVEMHVLEDAGHWSEVGAGGAVKASSLKLIGKEKKEWHGQYSFRGTILVTTGKL
ncbi:hypothetical protein RHMOL_Rhmol02G0217300 [Rhododendron molle]|uniref:Uncharacterized protein n=1 Tax=Rhododendron molle TaxID=49168 RepID=A0ACC0PU23_RHOML|nr:hypothetical protein RHMOL_Rhmol02G0217300 [Rhododendron molle]